MNNHVFFVPAAHPCLNGHFPGNPIVPGVVILGEVLAGLPQKTLTRSVLIKSTRLNAQLLPDEHATVSYKIKNETIRYEVTVLRGGTSITIASGSLTTQPDESSQ